MDENLKVVANIISVSGGSQASAHPGKVRE